MAGKASPIGLRTWVWILAGLFVVCTLPLMAIALVQGTLRFRRRGQPGQPAPAAADLRLANLVSAERGPANSLLGADPADAPSRHGWPRSWRWRASGRRRPAAAGHRVQG
jgi:hypothetical protein